MDTAALEELLTEARHAEHTGSWVQATLTDPVRPTRAMDRLRTRFPHTAALRFAPLGATERPAQRALAGRSAHDVALGFVEHVRGQAADARETALLAEALACCPEDRDQVAEQLLERSR